MMKKPKVPTSLFKFLTVLENSVWGCILAAYFFTSFLMWVFDKFSPYSYQNNVEQYKDDEEKRFFSFKECLWFCMTSLTPQGGGEYSSDFLRSSQNLTNFPVDLIFTKKISNQLRDIIKDFGASLKNLYFNKNKSVEFQACTLCTGHSCIQISYRISANSFLP